MTETEIPNERTSRCLWLVDGYNVLRVSLAALHEAAFRGDGGREPEAAEAVADAQPPRAQGSAWWSQERRQLLQGLARRLDVPAAEIRLVFDARHLDEAQEQEQAPEEETAGAAGHTVRTFYVPSADDWIVRAVREESGRWHEIRVVTADRPLGDRARSRGAVRVSTADFVALCGGRPGEPGGG